MSIAIAVGLALFAIWQSVALRVPAKARKVSSLGGYISLRVVVPMANVCMDSQLRSRAKGDGQLEICGPKGGTYEIEVRPLQGTVGTIV